MDVKSFYDSLIHNEVNCFVGVPDSLLKYFCAYVTDNSKNHTITANEGNAIALAAGNYLSSGKIACVYMQNSGIGNCVNPLLSLTDEAVYNIPILLLIGWRGEPNKKDEPQHIKQGLVTGDLLKAMQIEFSILDKDINNAKVQIDNAFEYMLKTKKSYAFMVKKGTFDEYNLINKKQSDFELSREDAIDEVIKRLNKYDIIVSTTGQISRELYELREKYSQSHKQDFLTVGSMGHASSIALGIAINKPHKNIYCFDGDGAMLMHLGAIPVISSKKMKNFKHIVFNNEAHDSVGAQPTVVNRIKILDLAIACGYKKAFSVKSIQELKCVLPEFIKFTGTALLEIKVKCGTRSDLGRPKETPKENKIMFMENLND